MISEPIQMTPSTPGGRAPGRIVVAMYTFQGRSTGELSFQKGDTMEVLNEA